MLVSVIVPTLNCERYIRKCLASLDGCEVIVVDGGSTDSTVPIALQFKNTLIVGKDKNEPDAINKGLREAHGDILAWLDADDYYEAGALEAVAKAFTDRPEWYWLYGDCRIVDEHDREVRRIVRYAKHPLMSLYSYKALSVVDFIPQPATFFRRAAWEIVGELNDAERLVFDYEYWLRLGERWKPGYIPRVLASWRAHPESASVKQAKQEAQDALRVASEYGRGITERVARQAAYFATRGIYAVVR